FRPYRLQNLSAPELDLLAVGAVKDNAAPAALARLARGRVVRRARHLDALFLQSGDSFVEVFRFETEMKTLHRAVGPMGEFQHRVAEFQIRDLHAAAGGVLKIFFEAEARFVKRDGTVEVAHMNRDVVDSPEHRSSRTPIEAYALASPLCKRVLPRDAPGRKIIPPMPVYRLTKDLVFPPPENAEPDGLLAVGGDLSSDRLLLAYQSGIFPWFGEGLPILWWSPDPRLVLAPCDFHVSRRLAQTIKQGRFKITFDVAFSAVILACATTPRRAQDGTWITPAMRRAYIRLHRLGYAHSVE